MVVFGKPLHPRLLQVFKSILSDIESPEGLKPLVLKRLYYVLVSLSLETQSPCSNSGTASSYLDTDFMKNESKLMLSYLRMISDIIFKELSKKFKQLFSALRDDSVVPASLLPDLWIATKELDLILRCCLVILMLLEPEQNFVFEKCRVLLAILGRLCSLDLIGDNGKNAFSLKTSRKGSYTDDDCAASFSEDFVASFRFLEHSDPCLPIICKMLEVFLDELLVHRPLRQYFLLVDSVSSASDMLFICHTSLGDTGSLLELFSSHFLLSVSDEQALDKFLSRLFCLHDKNSRVPELSLNAALSLLQNPVMLSAPKILQAHLISLISDGISNALNSEDTSSDLKLMSSFLAAFERSVELYIRLMSAMWRDPTDDRGSFANLCKFFCPSSFESHIQPVMRNRISTLVAKLDSLWNSYLRSMLIKTKTDLLTASVAFLKGNEHILENHCKDNISSILNCVIFRALPDNVNDSLSQNVREAGAQDLFLLASILKLLSSSLLQAIYCMRHSVNKGCPMSSKESWSCKEYDFLVNTIGCFQQLNVQLPIQKFLYNAIDSLPTSNRGFKLALLHFSGMLSLSFSSGFDFLVKGSIFMMMALINLFTFEEDTLDELRSSLLFGSDSFVSCSSPNEVQEALENQRSSRTIASKFQRTRMLSLRDPSASDHTGSGGRPSVTLEVDTVPKRGVGIEDETEETCGGEIFLNCILQGASKPPDVNDLADFIECDPDKDYTSWLKNRQKFRKWKCGKMAVLRWKKMKKTWRCTKGRKT